MKTKLANAKQKLADNKPQIIFWTGMATAYTAPVIYTAIVVKALRADD